MMRKTLIILMLLLVMVVLGIDNNAAIETVKQENIWINPIWYSEVWWK